MLTRRLLLHRAREERGTTLVLMSLLLVALMGMSALVLDLGNARRVKRSAQGTSDSAALAAAQELGKADLTPAQRVTGAIAVARTYSERNLPAPAGGWAAAWAACADPTALSYVPLASGTGSCVSFDDDDIPTKVRVKVPIQQVKAQFAAAIGQGDPVAVSAAATAGIASPQAAFQGRLVLPIAHGPDTDTPWTRRRFRLRRSSPSAGWIRIYDGDNLKSWDKSCRKVDSSSNAACVFKSPRLSSFVSQVGTSDPNALRVNLAMGLDHDLGTYPSGSPLSGPPTRVCDLNASASIPSPCSTRNGGTGLVANHVITAQGSRWNWTCDFFFFCSWENEELPTYNDLRTAVDEGLALGDDSNSYFTVGGTNFCARLARPQMTQTNYGDPRPGGTCSPATPTLTLSWRPCILFCSTQNRTINGRHIGYYLTPAARTHFFGAPGGSGSGCGTNPTDPVPATDNVSSSRWNGYIENRLGSYLTQSETSSYMCSNPPAAPIFDAGITADPRFAWIAIVQSDCQNTGGWNNSWWDWSFRGGGFDWERRETNCAAGTPKYVQEYRAVYIDTITMSSSWWGTSSGHMESVDAWEFDPALIQPWTSYGPSTSSGTIDYQGGPAVPVLEQ